MGKTKFILALPQREKVDEMKLHVKNAPIGSTCVRPNWCI